MFKDKEKQRVANREAVRRHREKVLRGLISPKVNPDGKWDVSVPIPAELYEALQKLAGGDTNAYIIGLLKRGTSSKGKPKLEELRKMVRGIETKSIEKSYVPLNNPAIHKAGDRVLIRAPYSKKLVEIIIPEIDGDGNPVPIIK